MDRHVRFALVALSMVALLLPVPTRAQGQEALSAQTAQKIIDGCVTQARSKKQSHAIAVYDLSASPVAFLRMDGNLPGIGAFAMEKAKAVAMWGFSTSAMAAAARETPGFASAPNVVSVPGGVPVYSADGKSFLGAVGVSGEAAADDVACAEAGIKAAGLSAARRP